MNGIRTLAFTGLVSVTLPFVANSIDEEDNKFVREAFSRSQDEFVLRKPRFEFPMNDANKKNIRNLVLPSLSKDKCSVDNSRFVVVSGPSGTGKTYFVKSLIRERQTKSLETVNQGGMIYLSCNRNVRSFEESFAEAIGYREVYRPGPGRKLLQFAGLLPDGGVNPLPFPLSIVDRSRPEEREEGDSRSVGALFTACIPKFVEACKHYNRQTGFVPVLVIDNADYLCESKEGLQFLSQLKRLAKDWVDNDIVKLVFIGNDRCSKGGSLTIEEYLSHPTSRSNCKFVDMSELSLSDTNRFINQLCNYRLLVDTNNAATASIPITPELLDKKPMFTKEQERVVSEIRRLNIGGNLFVLTRIADAIIDPSEKDNVFNDIQGISSLAFQGEFADAIRRSVGKEKMIQVALFLENSVYSNTLFTSNDLSRILGPRLFDLAKKSTCLRYHTETGCYSLSPYLRLLAKRPQSGSESSIWNAVSMALALVAVGASCYVMLENFDIFGNNNINGGSGFGGAVGAGSVSATSTGVVMETAVEQNNLPVAVPIENNDVLHL